MRIAWTFPFFVYFSAKTDPETEGLGREKIEIETEFKILQPPNTTSSLIGNVLCVHSDFCGYVSCDNWTV